MTYSNCSQFVFCFFNFTLQRTSHIWHKYTIVTTDQWKYLVHKIMHFTHDPVCVENVPKWKSEIKIKQTSRRVKFENPHRGVPVVYHPTPGHFLAHQKACCERRFRHMSHHFLLFFPTEWVDERRPFCFLHGTVFSFPLLLNSAMAASRIHICCAFVAHTPILCVSSFYLSSSHKSSVYHVSLMCREWISQSVTSIWNMNIYMNHSSDKCRLCICMFSIQFEPHTHIYANKTHGNKSEYDIFGPPEPSLKYCWLLKWMLKLFLFNWSSCNWSGQSKWSF